GPKSGVRLPQCKVGEDHSVVLDNAVSPSAREVFGEDAEVGKLFLVDELVEFEGVASPGRNRRRLELLGELSALEQVVREAGLLVGSDVGKAADLRRDL